MFTKDLSVRKKKILTAIVEDYIIEAEPVGSKHLMGKHGFDFSPATIRNEMAELEVDGFILQPYTSAGRIPTDKGYRYYVDNLMRARHISEKEERSIRTAFIDMQAGAEEAIHETVSIISSLTRYATVATFGKEHKKVYFSGVSGIASQPEFKEASHLKNILRLFDEDELLGNIIEEYSEEGELSIRIGSENRVREIKECSVVVSSFTSGSIGVIGPTRMFYNKVSSIIEYVKGQLSDLSSI